VAKDEKGRTCSTRKAEKHWLKLSDKSEGSREKIWQRRKREADKEKVLTELGSHPWVEFGEVVIAGVCL
jgi:hypothetical protein